MTDREHGLNEVRKELIALLRRDEFKTTKRARTDCYRLGFTECGMVDLILEAIEAGFALKEVFLGDPPGSTGVGYAMTNVDRRGLYVKLKWEWDHVLILSFHPSIHERGE